MDMNSTKPKERQARSEKLIHTFMALRKVLKLAIDARDTKQLLDGFCHTLVETRGYKLAWIGLAEPTSREVRPVAWAPPEMGEYVHSIRVTYDPTPLGSGPTGTAIRTGQPSVCRDMSLDERFAPWQEQAKKFGFSSSLAVPMSVKDRPGAVNVYASESDAFDEDEVAFISELVEDLSIILHMIEDKTSNAGDYAWHILENVPALILGLRRDGRVELLNKACEELTGYSRDELKGKPAVPTLFRESTWAVLKERMCSGQAKPCELPICVKAGGEKVVEWRRGDASIWWGGEPLLLLMGLDITERKRLEEHLAQAEKLSALGELIAGVAHELNNPLTGVIGFSQIISEMPSCPEDIKKDLLTIRKNAQRCKAVVENLLRFARQSKPERKVLHVRDVLDATLELLAYQFRVAGVEVVTEYGTDVPPVLADSNELQQVFVNILTNAMQAIKKSGKGHRVVIRTLSAGPNVRIEFEDDGPGIAPEHLPKIFDPFFTTKPPGEGTGLGLSVCFGIITAHKGRIWAESEYGKGAKFIIQLPAAAGQEAAAKPSITTTQLIRLRQRVMIVDDEDVVLDVLERILESLGFKVIAVRSAEQALEMLEQQPVDFILCDLRMPGIGGPGLYEAIAKRDPGLANRIIFCTGDTVSHDAREFLRRTRCRVVSKPFNMSQLMQTLSELQQEMLRQAAGKENPGKPNT